MIKELNINRYDIVLKHHGICPNHGCKGEVIEISKPVCYQEKIIDGVLVRCSDCHDDFTLEVYG